MKANNITKRIVMAALLTALTCVATMVVKIPSPLKGYLNLGDCVVLLSGWMLGPVYGFWRQVSAPPWRIYSPATCCTHLPPL